jgi:hypothetical protein
MVKRNEISELVVQQTRVAVVLVNNVDYISLTDIARRQNSSDPSFTVKNWLRRINTIDYIGLWEKLRNPDFNLVEFDQIKTEYGKNSFSMSPTQWVRRTNAIGIVAKGGRYSIGTFAHPEIAFEFASWISPEFRLYLVLEFERLKQVEQEQKSIEWNLQRTLSKINYHIHTDAIKEYIIPKVVNEKQKTYAYANEADLLNVALFGKTAAEWRAENPNAQGNIRDEATLEQLVVLSNLESINALLIRDGLPQSERLTRLNATAIVQLKSLLEHNQVKRLDVKDKLR